MVDLSVLRTELNFHDESKKMLELFDNKRNKLTLTQLAEIRFFKDEVITEWSEGRNTVTGRAYIEIPKGSDKAGHIFIEGRWQEYKYSPDLVIRLGVDARLSHVVGRVIDSKLQALLFDLNNVGAVITYQGDGRSSLTAYTKDELVKESAKLIQNAFDEAVHEYEEKLSWLGI